MIDLCAIRKVQTALKRFEETLQAETGLSLNEAMCLCAIKKGLAEPGMLARELELSPSRLTRILDGLEGRKLVSRRLSDGDRRSITAELTARGNAFIEKYQCADIPLPDELAFTRK